MTKKQSTPLQDVTAVAQKAIESVADVLGVAVTELWTIFVKQYVVRGITELFTAIILFTVAYLIKDLVHWYALIPAGIGLLFVYGSIPLLVNPKYYAIDDVYDKVKNFKNDKETKSGTSIYY